MKGLNDSIIISEEKISALLKEKNKLQEETFQYSHKADNAIKEYSSLKDELNKLQIRSREQELLQHNSNQTSKEIIDSLHIKNQELVSNNHTLSSQNRDLNESLVLSNAEVTKLKENSTQLLQANLKVKALNQNVETLKQQLTENKSESETKMEGLNDRIKKLKGLLSKVNSLAQEKEVKLNQLQSHHDPAKRFSIVVKLSSRSHSDDVDDDDRHEMIHWCLIYEHSVSTHEATDTAGMIVDATTSTTATTTMNTSPQYRWIEERIVHKWISEGSILVGEWPQSMQDKHNHDLHTMRSRLENERDKLIAQNSEVTNQFQSYKIRAQTALKRIGTEDRHEKLKVIEQESAEIERLKNIINGYKDKENELMIEIGRKDGMIVEKDEEKGRLLSQIELLDSAILDNEQKLQIMERKITLQQKEIDSLHDENRSLEEQYEAAEKSHRERLRALQKQRNTSNDFMMMDDDAKGYQSNNGYNLSNNNSNNNYNNNNNNSSNSHPSNSAPGYNNQNITAVNNNTSTSSQLSSSSTSALASASSTNSSDPSTTNDTTTQIHISSSSILKRDDPSIEAEAVIAEPIDEVIDSTNMNMHQSSTKLLLFKQVHLLSHQQ